MREQCARSRRMGTPSDLLGIGTYKVPGPPLMAKSNGPNRRARHPWQNALRTDNMNASTLGEVTMSNADAIQEQQRQT